MLLLLHWAKFPRYFLPKQVRLLFGITDFFKLCFYLASSFWDSIFPKGIIWDTLLYKLECFMGISTSKENRISICKK